jgi:very-short-patch-repair endonuclease
VKIVQHVKRVHGLSKEEYVVSHGPVLCDAGRATFSRTGRTNGDWIERRKSAGDDLLEYRTKMGAAVSATIMDDPIERTRRSKLMGDLNGRPEARRRSSETAKRTSSQSDVLARRSQQLADWRAREPEAFYEKCVKQMLSYRTTKPELAIRTFLQGTFPEMGFVGNQRLMSREHFHLTKSQKRQIDVMSKSHRIIVEVDGWLHFNEVKGWAKLDAIRAKDEELNLGAVRMGYALIRVSYDQWDDRTGEPSDACKRRLIECIAVRSAEVSFIGDRFEGARTLPVTHARMDSLPSMVNLRGDRW